MAARQLDFHPQLPGKPETLSDVEWMATSRESLLAEVTLPASKLVMPLALTVWQSESGMLSGNPSGKAIPLVSKLATLESAKRRLLADLDLPRTEQRPVQAQHLAARARLGETPLLSVGDSLVPLARAPRYSPGPGPCAFSLKTSAVRKCNRVARSGGRPICARYPWPRSQRAPADYGNKRSRWRRKRAHRAEPFPIAALDKYPCLPRQIAD
jgi:hypothetical protein